VQTTATRGYTLLNFKADETRKVAKLGVGSNFVYVYMLGKPGEPKLVLVYNIG
jgi:hypothetical protein